MAKAEIREMKRTAQEVLEGLRELRDVYSDEIPNEILSSASPNSKFKVRKGWWDALLLNLATLHATGVITKPSVTREVDQFQQRYLSDKFRNQPLTTADDIKRANEIINKVLGEK